MDFKLNDSIGYIVNLVGREMAHTLRKAFLAENLDITPEQWGVLAMLKEQDGRNQMEIACLHFRDKANITRLLDGLERRDLVRREQDPNDRRNNLIFLSQNGNVMFDRLLPIVKRTLEKVADPLSPEELALLKSLLHRLHDHLYEDLNVAAKKI